jgi:hypothetical protein
MYTLYSLRNILRGEDLPITILIYYLRHQISTMKSGFKDLLFYPDTFFKNIAQEKVNLIPPVIIVAGGCAISILGWLVPFGVYVITRQLTGNPFDLTYLGYGVVWFLVWYQVTCYILCPFLGWILVSGILYLISRLFSKIGSFFATLQNVGYGMVPWVISNCASVIATSILYTRSYYYLPYTTPDTFASYATSIASTGAYYYPSPLLWPSNVITIIFLVFLVWCCCLWVYAIKHTHQIPLRRATGIVLIVIMAYYFVICLGAYI